MAVDLPISIRVDMVRREVLPLYREDKLKQLLRQIARDLRGIQDLNVVAEYADLVEDAAKEGRQG